MDDRDPGKKRPEDRKDDQDAQDTEGSVLAGAPKPERDPGSENPTGRDESGEDRAGQESIIPKH